MFHNCLPEVTFVELGPSRAELAHFELGSLLNTLNYRNWCTKKLTHIQFWELIKVECAILKGKMVCWLPRPDSQVQTPKEHKSVLVYFELRNADSLQTSELSVAKLYITLRKEQLKSVCSSDVLFITIIIFMIVHLSPQMSCPAHDLRTWIWRHLQAHYQECLKIHFQLFWMASLRMRGLSPLTLHQF